MKHSLKSTEFWFALLGHVLALYLVYAGDTHEGVVLMVGAGLAYGLSRGVAKHGYGKALNRPNQTRL
jgi:hypothetical protein